MNGFLRDFLAYFMPDLLLPAWMEVLVGIVCLTYFFKFLLAVMGIFSNGRY